MKPAGILTKRQREVLEWLRDNEEDTLIYERGGHGYIAESPVSGRTVYALLRLCAIKKDWGGDGDRIDHFQITGTGRQLLQGIISEPLQKILVAVGHPKAPK